MKFFSKKIGFLVLSLFFVFKISKAEETNEFKIKRENDFSFQKTPSIEKSGEGFYISFEVKSFCDVTIVIEEEGTSKILRHLISGVLGNNAPEPFLKNYKNQK